MKLTAIHSPLPVALLLALGWPVYELEADHNPQRSARDELVDLIQEIARTGVPPSDG